MGNSRNADSSYSSFGQISDPGTVSGSVPIHESTAGAIGGALGGLAKIAEVGIKYRDQSREAKIGGAVEDALAAQVKDFQGQPTSTLLGESDAEANPSVAAGFSSQQAGDLDKLRQANAQQRPNFSRAAFFAKTSAIVQDAIHDNPRYESAIRKRAQEVLGLNPTAAAVSLEVEGQKAADELNKATQARLVQQGADRGEVSTDNDGNINVAATVSWAATTNSAEHVADQHSKWLADQEKEASIQRGYEGSLAERNQAGEVLFLKGKGEFKGSDAKFDENIQGGLSNLPALMRQHENDNDQAKIGILKDGIVQAQRQWDNWLDVNLAKTSLSTESRKRIREEYQARFDHFLKSAEGGYDHFKQQENILKGMATQAGIQMHQAAPGLMALSDALGPQVAGQLASTALLSEQGTQSRIYLNGQVLSVLQAVQIAGHVAEGKKSLSDFDKEPEVKRTVLGHVRTVVNSITGQTDPLEKQRASVDKVAKFTPAGQEQPNDLKVFGTAMGEIATEGAKSGTVGNLHGFLGHTASPMVIQTLEKLDKTDPVKAKSVASNMLTTNGTAIVKMGQVVASDLAAMSAKQPAGPDQLHLYYNPDKGQVEVVVPPINPSSRMVNIPRMPKDTAQSVNDINQALNAQVLLQPWASDIEQTYNDRQLKQSYITSAGIPLKPGQSWVPMPGEKQTSSDTPQVGAGTGNLDRTTAGDNWATVEVGENGYHPTYVLPTQPGDRPANDETGFLGDAWERYKKTGKMYGRFLDENSANTYMKGPSSDNRVPGKLGDMIDQIASDEQVAPEIAHAFAMEESSGGKDKNDAGVVGKGTDNPMQLHPDTAAALGIKKITKSSSITGGIRYIRQLMDKYDGQPDMMEKVAAGYIAGPGKVEEYLKNPDKFPNTQKGVKRILKMLGIEKQSVNIQVSD